MSNLLEQKNNYSIGGVCHRKLPKIMKSQTDCSDEQKTATLDDAARSADDFSLPHKVSFDKKKPIILIQGSW